MTTVDPSGPVATGSCAQEGCTARQLGDGRALCIVHIPAEDRPAVFARARDAGLVARGITVSADDLRAWRALVPHDTSGRAELRGWDLTGSTFGPTCDLTGMVFGRATVLDGCRFEGGADLSGCQFAATTSLRGVRFATGTVLRRTVFGADTTLVDVVFEDGCDLTGSSFGARCTMTGVRFGDRVDLRDVVFHHDADLTGSVFGEDATFHRATFGARVKLADVRFGPRTNLGGTVFGDEVQMTRSTIDADSILVGARFGERCVLAGTAIRSGVDLFQARFGAGCDLRGLEVGAGVRMSQVAFGDDADLSGATFGADADLRGLVLGDGSSLRGAVLGDRSRLDQSSFGERIDATDVTFGADLSGKGVVIGGRSVFVGASFGPFADLTGLRVGADADLSSTRFGPSCSLARAVFSTVDFSKAVFEKGTTWDDTRFDGRANFTGCRFGDEVSWRDVTSQADLVATGARFGEDCDLSRLSVTETIDLSDAHFGSRLTVGIDDAGTVDLSGASFGTESELVVSSAVLLLTRSRFRGSTHLRVRWSEIDLSEADLYGDVLISMGEQPTRGDALFAERTSGPRGAQPRLISLREVDAGRLLLSEIDLAACRFEGAHNLDHLRLDAKVAFVSTPRRLRVAASWPPVWRWSARQVIADEYRWRQRETYAKRAGWSSELVHASQGAPNDCVPLPIALAGIYRGLRKAREDARDESGARDFYYGEMEMRRHASKRLGSEHLLLTAYWAISGYALRATRSFMCLVAVIAIAANLYASVGFTDAQRPFTSTGAPAPAAPTTRSSRADVAEDIWSGLWSRSSWTNLDAWTYSAGTALNVTGPNDARLETTGRVLRITLRLVGPLLIGLTILALRSRVKR